MRNLKSMVAFLVVAAMLFASFTTFAYNDVAADADYASAVEVLSALEILKGDDKGNFNPDNTITRAESAAVIVRMLGLEDEAAGAAGATQFVDVASDHWGSGYINMAAQSGIIAGYGDGNFGPEDPVTYEQFVKMLVCALGYEPQALVKGTYPTGYLIAAKDMKLTKGVVGSAGQEAARSIVAQLAYNALDVPLMEQDGWGSDITYKIRGTDENYKTLLTEKLDIIKTFGKVDGTTVEKGTITFTPDATNTLNKLYKNIVDASDFYAGTAVSAYENGTGAADTIYMTSYAYLKEAEDDTDADWDLLAVVPTGKEDTLTIASADIKGSKITKSGSDLVVKYYDEDGDEKTITAKAPTSYYLNGVQMTSIADIVVTNGDVKVILKPGSEDEANGLLVTEYKTAVVKEASESKKRITLLEKVTLPGTTSQIAYLQLDTEVKALEDVKYSIVDTEGNDVAIGDLKKNDVLKIKANANGDSTYYQGKNIEIIVSTATAEGKITGRKPVTVNDKTVITYVIGGTAYPVDPTLGWDVDGLGSNDKISVGDEGVYHLNADGKIAAIGEVITESNFAFFYYVKEDGDGNYSVKVLDKDGLNTYSLLTDKNVKVNGTSGQKAKVAADAIASAIAGTTTTASTSKTEFTWAAGATKLNTATAANAIGEIKVNADGVITEVNFGSSKTVLTGKEYKDDTQTIDKRWLSNDVIVYNINEEAEDETEISVGGIDSLVKGDGYAYVALKSDDDGKDPAKGTITIMAVFAGGPSTNIEAPIAIVTDKLQTQDEDEINVDELTILSEGVESTIIAAADKYAIGDILLIVKDADGKVDSNKTIKLASKNASAAGNDVLTPNFSDAALKDEVTQRQFLWGTVEELNNSSVQMKVILSNHVTTPANAPSQFRLTETEEVYVIERNNSGKTSYRVGEIVDLAENDTQVKDTTETTGERNDVAQYALVILDEDNVMVSVVIVAPANGVYDIVD